MSQKLIVTTQILIHLIQGLLSKRFARRNESLMRNAEVLVPETKCTSDGYHEKVHNRDQYSKTKEDGKQSEGKTTDDKNTIRKPDSHHQKSNESSMSPLEDISTRKNFGWW